jgi:chondroitin 4-sulfotransferase 11
VISFEHKFIFVHCGRTGGTSMERMAGKEITTDPRTLHLGNTDFEEKHKNFSYYQLKYPNEFSHFYKFTIVRNPYERLVSRWKWRTEIIKELRWKDFGEFVRTRPPGSTFAAMFKLQELSVEDSIKQFDYIGRFENLDDSLQYLCQHLKIPFEKSAHYNPTRTIDYREFYTDNLISFVQDFYAQDLKLFGYAF